MRVPTHDSIRRLISPAAQPLRRACYLYCHPERSKCFAKRSAYGVEGPRCSRGRHGCFREFPLRSTLALSWKLSFSSSWRMQHRGPSTSWLLRLARSSHYAQDDRFVIGGLSRGNAKVDHPLNIVLTPLLDQAEYRVGGVGAAGGDNCYFDVLGDGRNDGGNF
jgi:hypothetical protein